MGYPSTAQNTRLSWLPPWAQHGEVGGPWVLSRLSLPIADPQERGQYRHVSEKALLRLIGSVACRHLEEPAPGGELVWMSTCSRFSVRWSRSSYCETRLFIQQRSDHYAELELSIDGEAVATFQEPVWPHLQTSRTQTPQKMRISAACIEALESHAATPELPEKVVAMHASCTTSAA